MSRKWSPEQKREQAAAMRRYWEKHPHPRKDSPASPETKALQREVQDRARWEQKGSCKRCGGPLFSERSVRIGYGPNCLKQQIAEGCITFDPYTLTVTEIEDASQDRG